MERIKQYVGLILVLGSILLVQEAQAQIFTATGNPAGDPVGNPDAVVTVNGSISGGFFLGQTPEACVQGDGINFNDFGEDPEWRYDIIVPNAASNSPVCSNIELRVCRRGDFGQVTEITYIYDENLNEIGNIPGHPSNSTAFDCTPAPICTIISLPPCIYNENVSDGIFSIILYTNGDVGGNSVGDFCDLPSGPQNDGDAASCNSLCPTYTQSSGGVFQSQNNGGPMVNDQCDGCNCTFIDYFYLPIEVVDSQFVQSDPVICLGENVTLTPNPTDCEQRWTVNGGTAGLSSTTDNATFTPSAVGTYTICNIVGNPVCPSEECKQLLVVEATITCPPNVATTACGNGELTNQGQTSLPYSTFSTNITAGAFASEGGSFTGQTPVTITYSDSSNGQLNPEVITRTFTLTEANGCQVTCTQTLTLTPDPVNMVCPADFNLECVDDLETALSSQGQFESEGGSISDECGSTTFQLLSETIE